MEVIKNKLKIKFKKTKFKIWKLSWVNNQQSKSHIEVSGLVKNMWMQTRRLRTSEWKTRWALAAPGAILNSKRRKPLGSLNHSVWARFCSETDLGEIRTKARWGQCLHFKVQRHIWHISLDVSYLLLILYTWPEKAQLSSTQWPKYEEAELAKQILWWSQKMRYQGKSSSLGE